MDNATFYIIVFIFTMFLTIGMYWWGYANGKRIGIIEGHIEWINEEITEIEKGIKHA